MAEVSIRRVLSIIVLALIMAAFSGPVLAQEEAEAPQEEAEQTPDQWTGVIEEIVVTAQKREQNIQDVPVSISTLSGEDLDTLTTAGVDVRMLSGRVPSLVMESSFGRAFPRFYIRGLGNPDFDLNASQPVSMVVDEVVMENPIVKGMPLFDLDRIEVLRGPQGTLFGRNTPAGIVKFETRRPSQEFSAFARASYGTYDTVDIQAGVGGALSKTFSARFSGLYQSRSDWVDNEYEPGPETKIGGYTTIAARLQFLWEPNDRFSGLLNLHGWDVDGTARMFRANILKPGGGGLIDGFAQDKISIDGKNSQDIESQGGVLRLEYDFGAATFVSVTGYETLEMLSRGDIDGGWGAAFLGEGNFGPGLIIFESETADGMPYLDQWTQEFRLVSNSGGAFNWLAGVFYFTEEYQAQTFSFDSLDLAGGNPQNGYSFFNNESEAYALFGSVDWQVSDSWNLKAGIRFSHDEKDTLAQRVQPTPFYQFVLGTQPSVPIPTKVDDSFTSWDLAATWAVNDNFNVYGRLATGFRAPSVQGRILFCADVDGTDPATNCVSVADTEKILSFEAGIKTILAQNKLRFNLTGYIFEVSDQQITAVGGEFNTATLLNADKIEGYGLETDIQWTPTGNWAMTFGASYNPTKINDPDLTVATCAQCTVTNPTAPSPDDPDALIAFIDGNNLPHAPEVIFNGIVNFQSDPADKDFFFTLDWAYYSEKQFFLYESEEYKDDSFELGLRLGYAFSEAKYEVALYGRNITDAEIVRGGIDFNNLTGFMNDPRIVGVEFVARF